MRFLALMLGLICSAPLAGQAAPEDPYSISFVQANLRIALKGPGPEIPSVAKNFQKLGDGVSIALIKILDDRQIAEPKTVEIFLPLIRQSFSYPSLISLEVNKTPRVTMLLLTYLERVVSEPNLQRNIEQTAEFVKQKTGN
jgi:hypothetical protein